jgi:hypothetical protein
MKKTMLVAYNIIGLFASGAMTFAAGSLLEQANDWQPGQPVPLDLLSYHHAKYTAAYVPGPDDTATVIAGITNTPLLVEMLFAPSIDEHVFESAVERALRIMGPQNFFTEVGRRYDQKQEWLLFPLHKRLYTQLNQRHLVVEAMSISESEMSAMEAVAIFRRAVIEMKAGKRWDPLFDEYSSHLQRKVDVGRDADKPVTVSKLARFGPFIVADQSRDFETLVTDSLPPSQRAALLKSSQGDFLLIQDSDNHRVVLYHVRDVYLPIQYKKVAQ